MVINCDKLDRTCELIRKDEILKALKTVKRVKQVDPQELSEIVMQMKTLE